MESLLTVNPDKRLTAEGVVTWQFSFPFVHFMCCSTTRIAGALKHKWLSPAANVSSKPLPSPKRLRGSASRKRFTFSPEEIALRDLEAAAPTAAATPTAIAEDDPTKRKLDMAE